MGTMCRTAPAAAYSSASRAGAGTVTWHSHPSSASWRSIRIRACSDPPPSHTGCTERMRLVRIAVNAEQLLYRSPGGVGRYTAQLLTLLPSLFPDDEVVPFTARHRAATVASAFKRPGVDPLTAGRTVVLGPGPVRSCIGVGWARAGPALPVLHGADLVHAPSVAVPPHPGVPLVVTVLDTAPALFPESFPARGRRFHRRGLAAAGRRADLVLTVSEAAAAEIAAALEDPGGPDPGGAHRAWPKSGWTPGPGEPFSRVTAWPDGRTSSGSAVSSRGRELEPWWRPWPACGVGATTGRPVGRSPAGAGRVSRVAEPGLLPAADAATLGPALHQLGQVTDRGTVVAVCRGHGVRLPEPA